MPAFACGALVLALALQAAVGYGGVIAPAEGLAPRRPHLVSIPLAPEYPAIARSPIFAPDRRPSDAASGLAQSASPLAKYALLGVAVGRSKASALIVTLGAAPNTYHQGDLLEGWRVASIERTRVIFERNGLHHVLVVGEPAESPAASASADSQ
jgi:hypothetical protein